MNEKLNFIISNAHFSISFYFYYYLDFIILFHNSELNRGLFCSSILCTTVWRMFHSINTFGSWQLAFGYSAHTSCKSHTLLFQWNARKIKIYYETKCTSRSLCFVYLSFNQERNEKKRKEKKNNWKLNLEKESLLIAYASCLKTIFAIVWFRSWKWKKKKPFCCYNLKRGFFQFFVF